MISIRLCFSVILVLVHLSGCSGNSVKEDIPEKPDEEAQLQLLGKVTKPRVDRRPPPPDRLLSEGELQTSPTSPDENPEWTSWLAQNANPIRSLIHDADMSDLAFLDALVDGRRVVQLGESSHGVSEFNMTKVRLIKYLHEHLGYDVVAFESGLLSCFLANSVPTERTPLETMKDSIYAVWQCEETLELFEYLNQTLETERPLTLAGFDYRYFKARPSFWRDIVACADSTYSQVVHSFVERLGAEADFGRIAALPDSRRQSYLDHFQGLAQFLDQHMEEIRNCWQGDPLAPLVVRQAAMAEARFLNDYRSGEHDFASRDSCMADNLEFLLDELYPDKKFIVWAHNGHIRHRGNAVVWYGFRSMGQNLAERRRHDLYTIGFFMGRGYSVTNGKDLYRISDPPAGTLAAVLEQARQKYLFVDLTRAPVGEVTSWMDMIINARTWGFGTSNQVLREQYDALIYVDDVQEPLFR